jgi:hypothetical protein
MMMAPHRVSYALKNRGDIHTQQSESTSVSALDDFKLYIIHSSLYFYLKERSIRPHIRNMRSRIGSSTLLFFFTKFSHFISSTLMMMMTAAGSSLSLHISIMTWLYSARWVCTLLKFPFRLLLLLLFKKWEREREIVLFGLFPVVYNSFFFSFSKKRKKLFHCTSFIEREHQPSLKAIK